MFILLIFSEYNKNKKKIYVLKITCNCVNLKLQIKTINRKLLKRCHLTAVEIKLNKCSIHFIKST